MSDATSILVLVFGTLLFTLFAVFTILYIALQKKKQYHHFVEKQEMQHRFSSQLMQSRLEVQEQTLKNLSAELHDNIAQVLGIAKMQLTILRDNADEQMKPIAVETIEMVGEAIQGVRDMSHVMNGTYILSQGLHDSIKKDLERISSATRIICNFNTEGTPYTLGDDKELLLFRIIQETVSNAVKHGEPTTIHVSMHYRPGTLQVAIQDDGKGFNSKAETKTNGIGLSNVEERTILLKGNVNITSAIGTGTKVTLNIPS